MSWPCRLFGHRWAGVITGFRNSDGAAIGRCLRCRIPIVDPSQFASMSLLCDYEIFATTQVRELAASGVSLVGSARLEILRRTVVYDEDTMRFPVIRKESG